MEKKTNMAVLGSMMLVLSFFLINEGFAATYYVSPSGDDDAGGSASAPFKTLVKAASVVNAGDTVLVSGGTYSEDEITPAASGTQDAMIVFKPNPGTGDVILMHPGTSMDDNTPVFALSNKSFIWIEGFQFKDFSYGKACVYISSGEGNVVINNRFENLGNSEVGSWDGNQVVALFNASGNVVCNNYFDNITGDGINVNSQSSEYNLISHNTFLNFKGKLRSWGGTYLYSRAIDVQDMSDGNNVIAFNYAKDVYHHIWLDRDGSNNVVLRNYGNTGTGTVFNESRCANNVVQENISIDMEVGFMSAYYETTGWTIEPRWINNVAYHNENGFKIHKSKRDEFRNNISFDNTDYNLIFTEEALSNAPHVFKNNLWYSENQASSIKFKGSAVSVSTFQSEVGETNGLSVDPEFTSLTSGSEDFTLQSSSPAKGAGDNGLDLGAYALYAKTDVGWDSSLQTSDVLVYFEAVVSVVEREAQGQLTLKLNQAASEEITVDIVPVAGDAVSGDDFDLASATATFQPGVTSQDITIQTFGTAEYDEIVAFQLENAVNALPGARSLKVLRINKTPMLTAYAGVDQVVMDTDDSGDEVVELDGSGSSDPDSTIVFYVWAEGEDTVATGVNPSVTFSVGTHVLTLLVTNRDGDTDTDEVTITVVEGSGIWLEAECGTVGSLWNMESDEDASNGTYVTIESGNNSTSNAPTDAFGLLTYTFDIDESGTYTLYTRVICPSANDDSFWLKMDDGSFVSWNNIASSTSWTWTNYASTYDLSEGSHTLTIGYREDGALLDKLWITNVEAEPVDEGADAGNCNLSAVNDAVISDIHMYPNPVLEELNLTLPDAYFGVSLYNSNGRLLFQQNDQTGHMTIHMANYCPGIYFVKITGQHQTVVKKIMKQ